VFADPEYRVNKRVDGGDAQLAQLVMGRAVLPSSLYPSVAIMLNWHKAGLTRVEADWLLAASVHLNQKMRSLTTQTPLTVELRRLG
jgi:hypothetical protein